MKEITGRCKYGEAFGGEVLRLIRLHPNEQLPYDSKRQIQSVKNPARPRAGTDRHAPGRKSSLASAETEPAPGPLPLFETRLAMQYGAMSFGLPHACAK